MGTWGTGVFASDLAADLRGEWRDGILDGRAPAELTTALIAAYDGLGDAQVFWTALAAAQHETGRLDAAVRDRALAEIARGVDEDEWGSGGDARRRAAVLERLAEKLRGPAVAPKKLRPPRPSRQVATAPGDVWLVRHEPSGLRALVAVAGHAEPSRSGEPDPLVVALDWDGEGDVAALDLAALSVVPYGRRPDGEVVAACASVGEPAAGAAEALGERVGGAGAHPYRLGRRRAGLPLVQTATSWDGLVGWAWQARAAMARLAIADAQEAVAAEAAPVIARLEDAGVSFGRIARLGRRFGPARYAWLVVGAPGDAWELYDPRARTALQPFRDRIEALEREAIARGI